MRAIILDGNRVVIMDGSLGAPLERLDLLPVLPVSDKYGCLRA